MPLETFANLPQTTVTSGGTTAPPAGTSQSWTVASSASFPAASNSATPPSQFHVADINANSEIITVTNVSGTTWTVTRGAEGTTPVTHTAGFTIYQVMTAGWLNTVSTLTGAVITQVAAPTGNATTDTANINAAITAWIAAGQGILQFQEGTYVTNGGHNIGGGSPGAGIIQGTGWNTEIQLANSANTDMFTFNGTYTRGLLMKDLYLYGNGGNQTSGNIINGYGAVWCRFDNIWFDYPYPNASLSNSSTGAIRLYQNGSGGYGQHNIISRCLFWNSNGNLYASQIGVITYQSDENWIIDNVFQNVGAIAQTYPSAVYDRSGLNNISGNVFVGGTGINVGGSGSQSRVENNMMDGPQSGSGQIYAGNNSVLITGNYCYDIAAGQDGIFVDNTDHVNVTGNQCQTLNNAAAQSGIHLSATPTYCNVTDNVMLTQGTGSYTATGGIKIDSATSITGCQIRGNIPFNPATVSTPSFPATTVTYTNATGIDVLAYVTNGTASMTTQVNGHTGPSLAASAGPVPVLIPAGGSFTPTYASGSPSWVFQGN